MGFFTKMAILISSTIAFSFLFSFLFFMAMLALFGPENNCGDISVLFCRRRANRDADAGPSTMGGKNAGDDGASAGVEIVPVGGSVQQADPPKASAAEAEGTTAGVSTKGGTLAKKQKDNSSEVDASDHVTSSDVDLSGANEDHAV